MEVWRLNGAITSHNAITLSANTNIVEGSGGSLSGQNVSLTATNGSIGASGSGNAIPMTTGDTTKQLNLTASAPATTSGNGNIYLTDSDNDVVQSVGPPEVIVPALLTGTINAGNNLSLTMTNGGIGVNGTVTTGTSITFNAHTNIIQESGSLNSQAVNLIATTGNIGTSGTPIVVGSGGNGTKTANVTLNAPDSGATANEGNAYITDSNNDNGSSPAMFLGAGTVGNASASGSGVINIVTSNGGVGVNGAAIATTSVTLNSHTNIPEGTGGSITAPVINLTASTGSIGSSSAPLQTAASSGQPLITALATSGSLYVYNNNNGLTIGSGNSTFTASSTASVEAAGTIAVNSSSYITCQ